MSGRKAVLPEVTRFYRLEVAATERVSPSFQRVTVTGDSLSDFVAMGWDQWFRLFTLTPGQSELRLPSRTNRLWYPQWLAIPADERPHCSNYTVRDYRPETHELDIDFVVHRNADGDVEGRAAIWATSVEVGAELGILDQGILFNPPRTATEIHLVTDESGVPAIEGILRSLDAATRGTAVIEVPLVDDIRELRAPEGIDVTWVPREKSEDPHGVPGVAALAAVRERPAPDPKAYVFVVGESELATGARRHLVAQGLGKDRISFCGFWKH